MKQAIPPTAEELALAQDILARAEQLDPNSRPYIELENAAARLRKTAKKRRKAARATESRRADASHLASRGLVAERDGTLGAAEARLEGSSHGPSPLNRRRRCYVCLEPFRDLHAYYHRLCPSCGDASLDARKVKADLHGRRALVTGGRIKIGFAIALRLLRDGAEVHVTSRFPNDAMRRYRDEPDAADWMDRLTVHGCDFRDLRALLTMIRSLAAGDPFDILINNAAQTVWRPPAYYRELHAGEDAKTGLSAQAVDERTEALLSSVDPLFPTGTRNAFGDPLDLRRENSWVMSLGDVPVGEFLESQVVNSIAPYVICSELLDSMRSAAVPERFVINVSAAEGQFSRNDKLARHPHTNMAKASLNMLTATSASELATDGIYMVSVDPGWVSHEGPIGPSGEVLGARRLGTPLCAEDGAARLYHPIASGIFGRPRYGVLLKDFEEVAW